MGLSIDSIEFRNFRNYRSFALEDLGALTIFVGPNAVGKTNIIEGIQLMTAISSFRKPKKNQLLMWETETAGIDAGISGDGRKLALSLRVDTDSKQYLLNGKKKRVQDIKGILPAVVFTPDDLELIKGTPTIKRASIDLLGSQLSSNYYAVKKDYEKILHQKNQLLKDDVSTAYLESINEVMSRVGVQLCLYRQQLTHRLREILQPIYQDITGSSENVTITYHPSWVTLDQERPVEYGFTKDEASLLFGEALDEAWSQERARGRAIIGPHSDTIDFFIDGKNASIFGSQGQQRSLVLAIKLAEVTLLEESLGYPPVLLLDDVMSELDERRRTALISFITGDIQTFITTTNMEYFHHNGLHDARIIELPLT